jgi:hypothetical protein
MLLTENNQYTSFYFRCNEVYIHCSNLDSMWLCDISYTVIMSLWTDECMHDLLWYKYGMYEEFSLLKEYVFFCSVEWAV